ncbi:MAG TPA: sigma-70 family RNA polymerase sigma factor [Verrucomicrobiae bacterium]|jgi:RNA polymerase sigma factor (sigma-70 family)|nr:sigma-70 family RNA polymerase sigma factor [Verrucomicrobiae bacterium]
MNSDTRSEDAQLVQLGVMGDRDAFGRLVARYQSPVCALAYSACGNISQSEDLAQEAFIIAWRKLGELREPGKFNKYWLFGIARNLINSTARKQTRNPLSGATPLDDELTVPAPVPNPDGQAISKEEEQILWRSLEQIPDSYREPLVLFYREHQSIEQVAATLELSEEATRQRLSRGRKLLQEQVVAFVEGALARTNPGQAFTVAVLAALPVTLSSSAKAATVAAVAAKGGSAATGVTFASALSFLAGPLIGLVVGLLGMRSGLKSTRTPRERAVVIRHSVGLIVAIVALFIICPLFTYLGEPHWKTHPFLVLLVCLGIMLAWTVFIFVYSWGFGKRFERLRAEEQQLHPDLFAGARKPTWMTGKVYEYRSRATFLGLPLFHYRMGRGVCEKVQPAVGWVAVGQVAYGILYASGGVAVGAISVGGISFGLLSFGGIGVGLLAFGGLAVGGVALGGSAIGIVASGGLAIGLHAALGGVAAARDMAAGGMAIAAHANDHAAHAFFRKYNWLDTTSTYGTILFFASCIAVPMLQISFWMWWGHKIAKRVALNEKMN